MHQWSTEARERALNVWRQLAGMYGARWLREFGEIPPDPWLFAIMRLRDAELRHGLEVLAYEGSNALPSLPGFVKRCREWRDDTPRRLEAPQADRFHVCGQMSLLRFVCGRQGVDPDLLLTLVREKNEIVANFRLLDEAGDDAAPLPRVLAKRFEAVAAQYTPGRL